MDEDAAVRFEVFRNRLESDQKMIPSVKYKVDSLFRKFLRGSYREYKLDL
ncbi:hypothetical protein [Leptospira borgpetersenii]|nr:hypothetical protein [Leptospira borgpetersenii]MBE8399846.1 hypothetical protein [Leptospira borgpetersenii serovar Tarassovi]MBE8403406.1 hypothetical protein [Leptospira borgpetersenii serovar Tarassovi]MBE8412355.1 hypothetical protein [Leptospira borgpetersenii serovar Tarassovi]MBE8416849.1 hypothetical protein [Leptospira borgpetersenii serovar Tarassovi]MBE8426739.1 hypothetical protein [Leptospira borgpetersenii serovar Tarassovi]